MEIKSIDKGFNDSYKKAGVDVTSGYEAVSLMKEHVERTMTPEVLTSIGGFGGLVVPDLTGMKEPVLVSGTDGVGTKLKVAFLMDKHDSVGIDCVAMCVNDIVVSGARPMFFLDYIAMGKNLPEKVAQIVSGVADGCVKSGCALIGGETAEMPGFYPPNEYDLAGFAVGIVDKSSIIDGHEIVSGDRLIGLASNGLHSNGFSLVRKVFDLENADLGEYIPELACTLGEELLKPTRIYAKTVMCITHTLGHKIKGMAHVTGGGIIENVPRMLPDGMKAVIAPSSIPTSPIFSLIYEKGQVPLKDMYSTFNMGIGFVMAVAKDDVGSVLESLVQAGERPYVIGCCLKGEKGVDFKW